MAETSQQRVRRVFMEVADLSGAARLAALDRACAGDVVFRTEVEALLRAEEQAGGFMSSPTAERAGQAQADSAETIASHLREGPGTRIGPYKLLQLIGEGGFGSVFMAEQEKPVVRKVALKIIKLGMDTRQVIARFEAERQALAMMDHPNIARVLDAGATETGRPFFVMDLVKGEAIVEYCDRNNLSIDDRLDLFAQVCNAVQHAHTKGIIHRDIKPSNILVSTQDGRPHTKVIDFGIAKATASKLTEKTLFTEHKAFIGTPEYMSPEQAEGSMDIDTRTDVYSLGVLLYELLTGTTPFGNKELRSAAYAEIQRIIREVEPPKPSTRISHNTDTIANVAARRHTEPRRLGVLVRGELDWIVMKALEKDRQRRYETANGLGMDIRRYLSGEAVVAAPPSTGYRFKKFIRRNRVLVTTGGAVAAALLIGVVAFAWQATVARHHRDLAVQAQQAADDAAVEARKQAAIAEAVAKFQTDMLAAADPNNLGGDKVTVVQAMEAAVKQLDQGSLRDQPLVEAGVRTTIGATLQGLARFDDAEPNLRKSLALVRTALPAGHSDIALGLSNLAVLLHAQNKLAEAEPLLRESLAIYRTALPAGDPIIARVLDNLAKVLQSQIKPAEAEPLLLEALEIRRAALPAGHPDIALGMNNLAVLLQSQNRLTEAAPLFRDSLQIKRKALPAGHPDIALGLNNLAAVLKEQNKLAEAEPLFREALEIRRAALPSGHPTIAQGLNNLAALLHAQNKPAEAELLLLEALEIMRKTLPAGHPSIAQGLNNLGAILLAQDKPAEAEPLYREALAIRRAALPAGNPEIAASLSNLARLQNALGQTAQARTGFDEAIAMLRQGSPDGSPLLARVLWRSGGARLENKDHAAALAELEEAVSMGEKLLPADHPHLKEYGETLARCKAAMAERGKGDPTDGGKK